jgi:hypothetical protein
MMVRDYVYAETEDACAICGVRRPEWLSIHHIDGDDSNNAYDNQVVLCFNCHHQYHNEKGLSREQIDERKRHLIMKTLTQYGLNALKIAARNNFGVIAMPFLLLHLVEFGYMNKEERQMGYGAQEDATARFAITESGRRLVAKWFS